MADGTPAADRRIQRTVLIVLAVHFGIRLLVILTTDLGIDEAYYVQYALYPDWSYFDHPPMVGWLIWLTTGGLSATDVFFVRLGPLLIGTCSLWVVYRIGSLLRDRNTGLAAMLLTASSFYHSIIAGTFILPDTPQCLFWLLALWSFMGYIRQQGEHWLWWFGVAAGFAMLSKYHGAFLVFGALLYFLLTNYPKLWSWRFVAVAIVPLLLFCPVIAWNLGHDMASVDFHGARVGNRGFTVHVHFLLREMAGQLFYNNPVNVLWIASALFMAYRFNRHRFQDRRIVFLLCVSVPLIGAVLGMALFNRTLPHWSGPGYYGLLLVGVYLIPRRRLRYPVYVALAVVVLGLLQIRLGLLPLPGRPERLGASDFTLDIYGWQQLAGKFDAFVAADDKQGRMDAQAVLITANWFPAGQIDYYLGFRKGRTVLVDGNAGTQHQYRYINTCRGGLPPYGDAYFLSTSRYFYRPSGQLAETHRIDGPHAITVERLGKPVYQLYVYRLKSR